MLSTPRRGLNLYLFFFFFALTHTINVFFIRFLKFSFYYIKSPSVPILLLGGFTDPLLGSPRMVEMVRSNANAYGTHNTETFYAAIFYSSFRVSYADTNVLSSNRRCFFLLLSTSIVYNAQKAYFARIARVLFHSLPSVCAHTETCSRVLFKLFSILHRPQSYT